MLLWSVFVEAFASAVLICSFCIFMKYYGDGRGSSKVVLSINLDKCKLMTKVK